MFALKKVGRLGTFVSLSVKKNKHLRIENSALVLVLCYYLQYNLMKTNLYLVEVPLTSGKIEKIELRAIHTKEAKDIAIDRVKNVNMLALDDVVAWKLKEWIPE